MFNVNAVCTAKPIKIKIKIAAFFCIPKLIYFGFFLDLCLSKGPKIVFKSISKFFLIISNAYISLSADP
jgi:hypothetical protein